VTELGAGTKNINRTEIVGGGRHLAMKQMMWTSCKNVPIRRGGSGRAGRLFYWH
jgi:hypothetical protein